MNRLSRFGCFLIAVYGRLKLGRLRFCGMWKLCGLSLLVSSRGVALRFTEQGPDSALVVLSSRMGFNLQPVQGVLSPPMLWVLSALCVSFGRNC